MMLAYIIGALFVIAAIALIKIGIFCGGKFEEWRQIRMVETEENELGLSLALSLAPITNALGAMVNPLLNACSDLFQPMLHLFDEFADAMPPQEQMDAIILNFKRKKERPFEEFCAIIKIEDETERIHELIRFAKTLGHGGEIELPSGHKVIL